jgi:hypothetical protein
VRILGEMASFPYPPRQLEPKLPSGATGTVMGTYTECPAADPVPPTERPPAPIIPHGSTMFLPDLLAEHYHGDPCERPSLSNSIAGVLDQRSPLHAHAAHPRFGGKPRKPKASLDQGTLIHALLLGGEERLEIVEADNFKTNAAKDRRDAARAEGRTPVLVDDYDEAQKKADVLRERFGDLGYVLDGTSELTAFWTEEAAEGVEVQCRGRFDHWKPGHILDLKSIVSADPRTCMRHVDDYGYCIQHQAYISAAEKICPELEGRVRFTFLFFELETLLVTPVTLNGEFREIGELRWRRAVELWARCLERDHWPPYAERALNLGPPQWAMTRELERQALETQ